MPKTTRLEPGDKRKKAKEVLSQLIAKSNPSLKDLREAILALAEALGLGLQDTRGQRS